MPESDWIAALLDRTSRTFALNIPLLDEPLRTAIGAAYLLLRAADTYEDAALVSPGERVERLRALAGWLSGDAVPFDAARDAADPRWGSADDRATLDALPALSMEIDRLEASLSAPIRHHTARVASDMARWVGRHREGALQLRSIRELEDYCYSVAGIVGELITDCFVAVIDPAPRVELELRASAADFGIGLQLVNVLKDAGRDAGEGRSYLPADFVPRPGEGAMRLSALVALAQSRLDRGLRYVLALPIEASGARRFCFVPLALATATLQVLARSGDRAFDGDDVKLSRERVLTLAEAACTAVADDGATRALWGRLRSELPASVVT